MWAEIPLRHVVRTGQLTLIGPGGQRRNLGDGHGKPLELRIHTRRADRRLLLNPHLSLGESFMDGEVTVHGGDIYDLLDLLTANLARTPDTGVWWYPLQQGMAKATRRLAQWNDKRRAKAHVAHHYDVGDDLYEHFLDADWQYSCAYFARPDDTLETAQWRKKHHIAAKLCLAPGQHVLDIGCGWGGLAIELARSYGVNVTGLTLSENQANRARERVREAGLENRVEIRLQDYRDVDGPFDRVVSVGMFEHVGVGYYATFFQAVRELLKPEGVALVHTIVRADGPGRTDPWVAKYIFPGGYVPAISEVVPHVEASHLWLCDLECLRLHYAQTLRAWRERFNAARPHLPERYDTRFQRMWAFYLAGSETAFRNGGHMVGQFQLARDQQAVPLSRDYITYQDARLDEPEAIAASG